MKNWKEEIIQNINKISGKYSPYEVFSDWIECCTLSISNVTDVIHNSIWEKREEEYLNLVKKYKNDEIKIFSDMLGMLAMALEEKMNDVLGSAYMQGGVGNKQTGQFFTPYHLSKLCAQLVIPQEDETTGKIHINDPSCGGGGMIIAVASVLKEQGVDYQQKMEVIAQDLDWKCVYMCYLQLSLLGISATCVQGDTLCEPFGTGYLKERVLYTPAKKGLLIW